MQRIVDGLLDALAELPADRPVDLVSRFAFPMPFIVICELLGVRSCVFGHPDRLEVGRAGGSQLAFWHGIHDCLGAPLARLEGAVAFGSLVRRFPQLRLAVGVDELDWGHGDGLVLRGLSELPVVLGPARDGSR